MSGACLYPVVRPHRRALPSTGCRRTADATRRQETASLPRPQVAIDARGASAQQAETPTLARPVAAWRARVVAAGLAVSEARPWRDEGSRGPPGAPGAGAPARGERGGEGRPARGARAAALGPPIGVSGAAGRGVSRRGGEGVCRNRAWGQCPDDDRRWQRHGRLAE
jgi:hypothetical protein